MERIIEDWLTPSESYDNFQNALKFDNLYRIQRSLIPDSYILNMLDNFFKKYNKSSVTNYWSLRNSSARSLFEEHEIISSCLNLNEEKLQEALDEKVISGTGDSFSSANAKRISLFELTERISYKLGKYYHGFSQCLNYFDLKQKHEIPYAPWSTTGFSLEASPRLAIDKGIMEAVERDAYLCHWYTKEKPLRLVLQNDPYFSFLEEKAKALGVSFYVFKLRSKGDTLPVILSLIVDHDCNEGTTFFCTGLACDYSFRKAFLKSTFELNRFVRLAGQVKDNEIKPASNLEKPMGRFYYYLKPEKLSSIEEVFDGRACEVLKIDSKEAEVKLSCSHHNYKKTLNNNIDEIFIYPGIVPTPFKGKLFTCLMNIPALQPLDYEKRPVLNKKRLEEFSGRVLNYRKSDFHPLP